MLAGLEGRDAVSGGERETTIWLARHGEVHNPTGMLYGRLPRMGLSVGGRRQAEALAERLATRPLQAVYSSPLLRARKTAEAVQARHPGLVIRYTKDLLETRTSWEGSTPDALNKIGWNYHLHRRHPTDETMEEIRDRTMRWLHRVLRRHAGGEVAAVSHGDPVLILVGALRGQAMRLDAIRPTGYIAPASVFQLRFCGERFVDARHEVPHARVA